MGVSHNNKAKKILEKSKKAISHPQARKTPKAPNTPAHHTRHAIQDLPLMPDPWLVAPTMIPPGLYLTDYHTIVNDAQLWVWRYSRGMKFGKLPFLDFPEMENLVCAIGIRSSPDTMRDGVFSIITDVLAWASEWDRKFTYRSISVHESKLNYYASLRQEFYNTRLARLGRLTTEADQQYRRQSPDSLKVIASIKPEVLMKITETCMEARHNFLEREKARQPSIKNSNENELISSQLSDKVKSDMVLDNKGSAEPGDDVKDQVAEQPPVLWKMPQSEQQLVTALDNWNQFSQEEERKRKTQRGQWLWMYGRPPAQTVPVQAAQHGRNLGF